MIAIISEYRYSKEELTRLKEQKAVINYTLLPQYYQSYAEEIARINYTLIRRMNGIIFRLKEYYSGTKEAIEYALYLKKPIKIITPEGLEFKLSSKEEWKQSFKDDNNRNITYKHQVLVEFNRKRSEYYDILNAIKRRDKYMKATEDVVDSPEEIERFVRALAPQYKMNVNYSDWVELCMVYKQLQFYYNNNIPYDLDRNEIFTRGVIEPDETPYFTASQFDTTVNTYESYEEESYGDLNLLEDMIYKGGVCV